MKQFSGFREFLRLRTDITLQHGCLRSPLLQLKHNSRSISLKFISNLHFTSKFNFVKIIVLFHDLGSLVSLFIFFPLDFYFRKNQELIKELSTPPPGSKDLFFPTKYVQPLSVQCKACFWKQNWSYWRNPQYNGVRFFMTIVIGVLFGLIFWNKGQKT